MGHLAIALRLWMTRGVGAGGGDEGAELGGVFLAGGEFDAGDDIDAAGIEEADGIGDVGGVEASGDDDGDVRSLMRSTSGRVAFQSKVWPVPPRAAGEPESRRMPSKECALREIGVELRRGRRGVRGPAAS